MRMLSTERGADLLVWLAAGVPVFFASDLALPFAARVAAVLLLAVAAAVGRRHPVVAAAVPAGLSLAASPDLYTDMFMIAVILFSFLLGRRTAELRTGLLFFGGVCLAGLVQAAVRPDASLASWLALLGTAMLNIMLPWLAGRYARQHDELVRAGWELAERLEREQDLIGERMRLRERSRIAADMHDSLGHELSLLALRAAALQVDPGLDDSARTAARELRESAARTTERLREVLMVLRDDTDPAPVLPPGDTVAALVERATGSGMTVTVDGALPTLPPMADRAAYRVVQEALTNAAKHAPGAAVTVRLGVDPPAREAIVTVTSAAPPAGPLPGAGSGGYGLVTLDERVRLAGGRLQARPAGDGFEVTTRLPLDAGAAAAQPGARRRLDLARRRVRRSIIGAIWVPSVALVAVLALRFGYDLYTAPRSVLAPQVYAGLSIGESRASVVARLPAYQADNAERPEGAPRDPLGTDECRFYRTVAGSLSPAYRLCFTDGRLSHKDAVPVVRP
jgi:signal transduction histidine kinase